MATGNIDTNAENTMKGFTLVLWSILLEALPFILLGTIISSLIQVFVSENTILRILPKNKVLRIIFAACIGFVFPVCECAIIPITRGLLKKGMPLGSAIAFMLATPIVNPVVLLSTYNAFPNMPQMVIYRGMLGFFGAILIGYTAEIGAGDVLREDAKEALCSCNSEKCKHTHNHSEAHEKQKRSVKETVREVIFHTNEELKSVGGYLIFGAIIAATMQMVVKTEWIYPITGNNILSTAAMMVMAFVLSLCSEADAFIASTFMLKFSATAVLGFLITGPMIDIKNMLMLFGTFKKGFVIKLMVIILLVCFYLTIAAGHIGGLNG